MCINSVFAWLFGQPCWTFDSREFPRSFWWPLRFRLWWKLGICFEGPGIVALFVLFNRENSYLFLMPFLVADWVLFLLVTDKSDKHPPRHPSVQICRGLQKWIRNMNAQVATAAGILAPIGILLWQPLSYLAACSPLIHDPQAKPARNHICVSTRG